MRSSLASLHGAAVLSLTLRIPHGLRLEYGSLLEEQLAVLLGEFPVLSLQKGLDADGPFALAAIAMPGAELKRRLVGWEDSPLGSLFDADVTDEYGTDLSRRNLGLAPRPCLVCGGEAKFCVVSRSHGPDDIRAVIERILVPDTAASIPERIGRLARLAVEDEARTFPKPGLVTPLSTGAHSDMDISTLLASSDSLASYWVQCADAGYRYASLPDAGLLDAIRPLGIHAEQAMLQATHRINAHKGLVFALGILCAAAGCLASHGIHATAEQLSRASGRMAERLGSELASQNPQTAGLKAVRAHGAGGARGQAMQGYPSVLKSGIPAFEQARKSGLDRNSCRVCALLALMAALNDDTNLIKRGGLEGLKLVNEGARQALEAGGPATPEGLRLIRRLEAACLERRLSPGGCADMLALVCFIDRLQNSGI